MLFDFGAAKREDFVCKTILTYVSEEVPRSFRALEWEPPDGRMTRYLNVDKRHTLVTWTAAGEYQKGPAAGKRDQLYQIGGLDEKVMIKFKQYVPNKGLELERGLMDIAVLQLGAVSRLTQQLGNKAYRQIFRETARVLKPKSRFLLFTEVGEELPDIAKDYFYFEEKLGDDDVGQVCHVLIRKDQKKKTTVRTVRQAASAGKIPRPRRAAAPRKATVANPQKDADDSMEGGDDPSSGISAQDLRDALL